MDNIDVVGEVEVPSGNGTNNLAQGEGETGALKSNEDFASSPHLTPLQITKWRLKHHELLTPEEQQLAINAALWATT
jgi:hypothetical protein